MHGFRLVIGCLCCMFLASFARADAPPDPLRLLPHDADFCIKIEQPRKLVEAFVHNDLVQDLQGIDAIRELIDSTNYHRFYQLIAYFEKELGCDRYELLDRLAGGGILLGSKFGSMPLPVVVVIQGKDEQLLQRFKKLALEVLEQELARQEAKVRIEKKMIQNVETIHIGNEFHAAVVGSAILFSNNEKALQQTIERSRKPAGKSLAQSSQVVAAKRLVEPEPLAWAWLNLETVHNSPQGKDIFAMPRNEAILTVLFGGWLDVARRAPFLCAGVYGREHGALLSVRMPAGREGMPPELATHIPAAGQPGSRPLLEPKGVLYSASYYLDISKFWDGRAKLFNDKQKKTFEDFDAKTGPFLAGSKFSKLLTEAGPYQRIVVAHQAKHPYKKVPGQYSPATAIVLEMREPADLSKRLESILRAAGLLVSTQVKLKLVEEKYAGHTIIAYRFPEDGKFPVDVNDVRFNFVPCFVTVGKQFVACSDLELCHELIDLLEKEDKDKREQGSAATACTRIYAEGATELMDGFKDRLFTQTILDQAIPPEKANRQVQTFVDWVRRLGVLQLESNYGPHDFRYDISLRTAPKKKAEATPGP
ncbi:MAG TPA: DUF3352 domain-containing protein [Gemmataceae bacterium]|nr:DUF3352 domain-containing protein [Gemmataceae bacterium]